MPSTVDRTTAEREAFLARYRMIYLRSVAEARGLPSTCDLRELAKQEALALLKFTVDGAPTRKET